MTSDDVVESTVVACSPSEGDLVKTDARGRLRVSREQRKAVLAKCKRYAEDLLTMLRQLSELSEES